MLLRGATIFLRVDGTREESRALREKKKKRCRALIIANALMLIYFRGYFSSFFVARPRALFFRRSWSAKVRARARARARERERERERKRKGRRDRGREGRRASRAGRIEPAEKTPVRSTMTFGIIFQNVCLCLEGGDPDGRRRRGAKGWPRGGQPPWRRVARWRRTVNRWRLVTAGALAFTAPNPPSLPPALHPPTPSCPVAPRPPSTLLPPPRFPPSFSSFTQAPAPWTSSLRSSKHNFAPVRRGAAVLRVAEKCERSFSLFYPFFRAREKKINPREKGRIAEAPNRIGPLLLGYLRGAPPARVGAGGIKSTTVFLARRVPAPLITSGGRIASQIMQIMGESKRESKPIASRYDFPDKTISF